MQKMRMANDGTMVQAPKFKGRCLRKIDLNKIGRGPRVKANSKFGCRSNDNCVKFLFVGNKDKESRLQLDQIRKI